MFMSAAALAQDVEMNMNVQVDDEDMPSANIQMTVQEGDDDEAGASVRVRGGGANMQVKVKAPVHVVVEEEDSEFVEERRSPPPPAYRRPGPVFRDCGTQRDPGCTMTRDGKYAMDAETFKGFLHSLRTQHNEILREEMSEKVLKRNYLTAAQLGLILDLFQNEITRLDVAKTAAPHVVNPQHALGFSSKWQNSISSEEYVELMSAQQE
ncbi:MAG: DUF4476 domain-containing protein [Myxococcaceae bacterium]|nr:DUF4476 domain-containing protein [Myxococcaceae bacterium]